MTSSLSDLKIGLVSSDTLSRPGGIQQHVLNLQRELKKLGHAVKIISPRYNTHDNFGEDVILLGGSVAIPTNDSRATLSVGIRPFAISDLLEEENFDVLHFHNPGFFLPLQILEAAQKYPRLTKILTVHTLPEGIPALRDFASAQKIFHRWFDTRIDGIILDSEPIRQYLPQKIDKPIRVIPNGVDMQKFNPEGNMMRPVSNNLINILFVGRIEERKGLIYLLKAYHQLRQTHPRVALTIVGSGPLKWECQEYVRENDLAEVHFAGRVSDAALPAYYRGAGIFCSPATHGESFGIVLLEALASGLPIVAFANTGYADTLKDYPWKDGLVPPRDVDALAASLGRLIDDESLRADLAEFGLKEAQNFAWPTVAEQILDFYEEVPSSIS